MASLRYAAVQVWCRRAAKSPLAVGAVAGWVPVFVCRSCLDRLAHGRLHAAGVMVSVMMVAKAHRFVG